MDNKLSDTYEWIRTSDELPTSVRGAFLFTSSFVFQGFFYLSSSERYFKLMTEMIAFAGIYTLLEGQEQPRRAIISAITAHFINWIFNSHQVIILHTLDRTRTSPSEFKSWIDTIVKKAELNPGISSVYQIGRPAREDGRLSETSDLDIRLIRRRGAMNWLRANIFIMRLRTRALFQWFPLDIYLLDNPDQLSHANDDEAPIELYKA